MRPFIVRDVLEAAHCRVEVFHRSECLSRVHFRDGTG
jgi:hypothetical protein